MTSVRMTRWLMILVALAAITCAVATSRALAHRDAALVAQDDLAQVRHDLRQIASAAGLAAAPATNASSPDADVNRHIRDAASKAGAAQALSGIETGPSANRADAPLLVRFEPLTMRQLVSFVHGLRSSNPGIRPDTIELSAAPAGPEERWAATVTITLRPASASGR